MRPCPDVELVHEVELSDHVHRARLEHDGRTRGGAGGPFKTVVGVLPSTVRFAVQPTMGVTRPLNRSSALTEVEREHPDLFGVAQILEARADADTDAGDGGFSSAGGASSTGAARRTGAASASAAAAAGGSSVAAGGGATAGQFGSRGPARVQRRGLVEPHVALPVAGWALSGSQGGQRGSDAERWLRRGITKQSTVHAVTEISAFRGGGVARARFLAAGSCAKATVARTFPRRTLTERVRIASECDKRHTALSLRRSAASETAWLSS